MSEAETADGDEVPAASRECAAPGWWRGGFGARAVQACLHSNVGCYSWIPATGDSFFAR